MSQSSAHAYCIVRGSLSSGVISYCNAAWRSISIAFPPPGTKVADVHRAGGLGALCSTQARGVPTCFRYCASSSNGSIGDGVSDSADFSSARSAVDAGDENATEATEGTAVAVMGAGDAHAGDADLGSVQEAFAAADPDVHANDKLFPAFEGVASWQPKEPRRYRELLTEEDFDHAGASEEVRRAFDLHNATQMERNRDRVDRAILRFRMHDNDTGSAPVQAAVLTERIHYMVSHLQKHRKDKHSRRGLQGMLNKRRKLLKYLRRKDFDVYKTTITELKLRDNYF